MEEQKRRNQYEYDKKAYDHIHLQAPKGKKDIIKNHAKNNGKSVNGFVNEAIDEKMERDNMSIKCTVIIQKEDDWYVATDVTSGVASQGKSIDESLTNLQEALALYYEDNAPEKSPEPVFVTTMEMAI